MIDSSPRQVDLVHGLPRCNTTDWLCRFPGRARTAAVPLVYLVEHRWVSAHANIRVASAARRGYGEALVICFRGGAFSAVLDLTLCVAGVTLLYVVLYTWYVARGELDNTDVPVLMVGYGFGASFVALFMQVGARERGNSSGERGHEAGASRTDIYYVN